MEIINQALNTLKGLSKITQIILILAVLSAFGFYSYTQMKGSEVEPTIQKTVGDINQGSSQTGENNNNNNNISF